MIPTFSKDQNTLLPLTTTESLAAVKRDHPDKAIFILFWADWYEPCTVLKNNLAEIAGKTSCVKLTWVRLKWVMVIVQWRCCNRLG